MSPAIRGILVLCEGNHCRSPIAAALLQEALGSEFSVSSAGLGALVDHPAHPEAERLLAGHGLDISTHRGRQLNKEIALKADLILVMDQAQKEACERLVPSTRGRVYLFGHWLGPDEWDIPDPFQKGPEVHRLVFNHIQRALPSWITRLTPRNP